MKKYHLNFPLLADEEQKLSEKFEVLKDKIADGKRAIERSTFVIDEKGKIEKAWRDIDINGHVEEILNFIKK